jgi:hypothetical protein
MNQKTLYTYNKTYGTLDASHKTYFPKFNSFTHTISKAFTHDHVIINENLLQLLMEM